MLILDSSLAKLYISLCRIPLCEVTDSPILKTPGKSIPGRACVDVWLLPNPCLDPCVTNLVECGHYSISLLQRMNNYKPPNVGGGHPCKTPDHVKHILLRKGHIIKIRSWRVEPVRDVSNRQCVVLWLQNLFQQPNITNTDGIVKDIPVGISPCMLRRLNIHRRNVFSPVVLLYCSLNKILECKWNVGCRNLFLHNLIHFIPNHWLPLALGDKFKLQTTCPIIRKHSQSRYRYRVSHSRFIQELSLIHIS